MATLTSAQAEIKRMKNNPAANLQEGSIIRQREKLDPRLASYVRMLAGQGDFTIELKVDEREVLTYLTPRWPDHPEWKEQAQAILIAIDKIVHTLPITSPTPMVLLRVSGGTSLAPMSLRISDEIGVVAAFDAVKGIMNSYLLPVTDEHPSLHEMDVGYGINVVCQPLPQIMNSFTDLRTWGQEHPPQVYGYRTQDNPAELPSIIDTSFQGAGPNPIMAHQLNAKHHGAEGPENEGNDEAFEEVGAVAAIGAGLAEGEIHQTPQERRHEQRPVAGASLAPDSTHADSSTAADALANDDQHAGGAHIGALAALTSDGEQADMLSGDYEQAVAEDLEEGDEFQPGELATADVDAVESGHNGLTGAAEVAALSAESSDAEQANMLSGDYGQAVSEAVEEGDEFQPGEPATADVDAVEPGHNAGNAHIAGAAHVAAEGAHVASAEEANIEVGRAVEGAGEGSVPENLAEAAAEVAGETVVGGEQVAGVNNEAAAESVMESTVAGEQGEGADVGEDNEFLEAAVLEENDNQDIEMSDTVPHVPEEGTAHNLASSGVHSSLAEEGAHIVEAASGTEHVQNIAELKDKADQVSENMPEVPERGDAEENDDKRGEIPLGDTLPRDVAFEQNNVASARIETGHAEGARTSEARLDSEQSRPLRPDSAGGVESNQNGQEAIQSAHANNIAAEQPRTMAEMHSQHEEIARNVDMGIHQATEHSVPTEVQVPDQRPTNNYEELRDVTPNTEAVYHDIPSHDASQHDVEHLRGHEADAASVEHAEPITHEADVSTASQDQSPPHNYDSLKESTPDMNQQIPEHVVTHGGDVSHTMAHGDAQIREASHQPDHYEHGQPIHHADPEDSSSSPQGMVHEAVMHTAMHHAAENASLASKVGTTMSAMGQVAASGVAGVAALIGLNSSQQRTDNNPPSPSSSLAASSVQQKTSQPQASNPRRNASNKPIGKAVPRPKPKKTAPPVKAKAVNAPRQGTSASANVATIVRPHLGLDTLTPDA